MDSGAGEGGLPYSLLVTQQGPLCSPAPQAGLSWDQRLWFLQGAALVLGAQPEAL